VDVGWGDDVRLDLAPPTPELPSSALAVVSLALEAFGGKFL
jgi:hypothetical protein